MTSPRQWNSTLRARTKSLLRSSPPSVSPRPRTRTPRTRKKRTPAEYARIYHSRARVSWVKSLPCCACSGLSAFFDEATAGRSHNAHTEIGGMGRKAGYETVVPFCPSHHRRYDEYKAPFDMEEARQAVKDFATIVAAAWRAREAA